MVCEIVTESNNTLSYQAHLFFAAVQQPKFAKRYEQNWIQYTIHIYFMKIQGILVTIDSKFEKRSHDQPCAIIG